MEAATGAGGGVLGWGDERRSGSGGGAGCRLGLGFGFDVRWWDVEEGDNVERFEHLYYISTSLSASAVHSHWLALFQWNIRIYLQLCYYWNLDRSIRRRRTGAIPRCTFRSSQSLRSDVPRWFWWLRCPCNCALGQAARVPSRSPVPAELVEVTLLVTEWSLA
jgi:hypothetical protein